jgi:branched-chain amino acid transport system permease protein
MSNLGVFIAGIVIVVCIYSLLTMALNLKMGMTGLVDIGLVAYFAIGAYAYVILTAPPPTGSYISAYRFGFGLPMWVGFIGAGLFAGLFAYIIGLPTLRLRGDYLAITAFGFSEIVRYIATNEKWLTNGVVGFNQLEQPFRHLFGSGSSYQYFYALFTIAMVAICYVILTRAARSPFGRTLKSIRENEEVALAIGKDIAKFRMRAYVFGSVIMGFAGVLYVWYTTVIVPPMFIAEVTWTVWISMTIGGAGNFLGAILGTAILLSAQELTRFFQASAEHAALLAATRFIVMGLLMVLIIRFSPKGILPEKKAIL